MPTVSLAVDPRDLACAKRGNAGFGAGASVGYLAGARWFAQHRSGVGGRLDLAELRLRAPVDRGAVQRDVPRLPVRDEPCRFAKLDGLLRVDVAAAPQHSPRTPRRPTAWFLAIAGAGVGVLWLSEIVVALPGGLPTNIALSELPNL
jgi:hypothetical protein